MKRACMLVFMIFCVGLVSAVNFNISDLCNQKPINDFTLPDKVPFSNEVINVYLGEESVGHIVLKNKKFESNGCEEHENPTYNVFIRDEQVIQDIIDAEDVIGEYNAQRADGGLVIDAVGVWRNIKLFFINFFSKFF